MTISDHLNHCYAEAHGLGHAGARAALRAAIADPALRAEAIDRRSVLVDAVTDKCHISRVHKAILDDVLKGA